jgi:hypothetical protein
MNVYALEQSGSVRGYFALSCTPAQARLVDCWMDSDVAADWLTVVQSAVDQATQLSDVAELVTIANDQRLVTALTACGFHWRSNTPIHIFCRSKASIPTGPLRVQMLDYDLAYLHQGYPEFWA